MTTPAWAELLRLGREPRNAFSNLAYVLAGWSVFAVYWLDPRALVFAGFMSWLGLGSFLYHSDHRSTFYRALDWSGMYGVTGCVIPLALDPSHPQVWHWMLIVGAGLAILLPFFWRVGEASALVGVLFALSIIPAIFNGDPAWALVAFGLFLAGKVAWLLDVHTQRLGLWGHALWHVLTGWGFAAVFVALVGWVL